MTTSDIPRIIPGELRGYEPLGDGTLLCLAEFSRSVTVTCQQCPTKVSLKLLTDERLPQERCDKLLDEYLTDIGWLAGPDLCPICKDMLR